MREEADRVPLLVLCSASRRHHQRMARSGERSEALPVPCFGILRELGMPKENDLEGRQDMGGKHGGQAGMSKPDQGSAAQQGIVRDEKGQEQPVDKSRAQHVSRADRGNDPPAIRRSARVEFFPARRCWST